MDLTRLGAAQRQRVVSVHRVRRAQWGGTRWRRARQLWTLNARVSAAAAAKCELPVCNHILHYALCCCSSTLLMKPLECSECKFGTYQIATCTALSNRKCAPCSSCGRMEYETSECTRGTAASAFTIVLKYNSRNLNNLISVLACVCLPDKDTVCGTCKQCEFLDAKARAVCEDKILLWSMQECCKTEDGRLVKNHP